MPTATLTALGLTPISEILALFIPRVKIEEGFRAAYYLDTNGLGTIGYGRHDAGVVPGMTCTEPQAAAWLQAKAVATCAQLDQALPWWREANAARADVVLDMAYNMGVGTPPSMLHPNGTGLRAFVRTLAAMENGAWSLAAQRMLQSAYAAQVGRRATRLAQQLVAGVAQPIT